MTCEQARRLMPDFLCDRLDPGERQRCSEHLRRCCDCAAAARDAGALFTALERGRRLERGRSGEAAMPCGDAFAAAVRARLDASSTSASPARAPRRAVPVAVPRLLVPSLAALCAVVLLAAGFRALDSSLREAAMAREIRGIITAMDTAQLASLERALDLYTLAPAWETVPQDSRLDAHETQAAVTADMFGDIPHGELLAAGSDYLSDGDILACLTPELASRLVGDAPSGDAPSTDTQRKEQP